MTHLCETRNEVCFLLRPANLSLLVVGRVGLRVIGGGGQEDDDNRTKYAPCCQQCHQPMASDSVLFTDVLEINKHHFLSQFTKGGVRLNNNLPIPKVLESK